MRSALRLALIVFLLLLTTANTSHAGAVQYQPIWVKDAVVFHPPCPDNGSGQRIESPDRRSAVEIHCRITTDGDPAFYLNVKLPGGKTKPVHLHEGANEVLWSPDSKAFFVDGGTSATWGFFVAVYKIEGSSLRKLNVTRLAQRDMVRAFPPCKAYNRDPQLCRRIEAKPGYNMSGIGWVRSSAAVIVMAEVPCSGEYGGIMCQVQGYELDASSGTILKRMSATELKKQWQGKMAWDMRIPDPPAYGPPCQTFRCAVKTP